jgi:ABC-type branched-subunit amino acid transport system substrate-binding protein
MNRSTKSILGLLLVCVLVVPLAGCGSKGKSSGGGGASGSVKTGPGVTDKTITLGLLTDLSGVFAPLAKPIVQETKLYWKDQNANGGVCNRTVKLVVKDHG